MKFTTHFALVSKNGVCSTFRFSDYSDNLKIGREQAYRAALRAQDAWERNSAHCLPEGEQQIALVER